MPDLTSHALLEKGRGAENFSNPQLNRNWDKIDLFFKQMGIENGFDTKRYTLTERNFFAPSALITIDKSNSYIRKMGYLAYIQLQFTFKSDVSVPSHGNITNQLIGAINPGWMPLEVAPLTTGATGRLVNGYINSAGNATLSATTGTSDISKTEDVSVIGLYVLSGQ